MRRVVITGLGLVTPIGNDLSSTWTSLIAGESGVRGITRFDASEFPVRIAAEVKDFDAVGRFGARQARRLDPYAQFFLAAALEAVDGADLEIDQRNRLVDFWRSSFGALAETDRAHLRERSDGIGQTFPHGQNTGDGRGADRAETDQKYA